ncbi:universal stress protein [Flavobacteriaceae bacterium S356]|uniref:Universal stress protein n=1 Tax=Asprobacillus argus TaxID=3076534 RepID=A0ABU3LBP0_9FLAO|nr:universal stress protein [Flavobacteriaceae bacterium S356]
MKTIIVPIDFSDHSEYALKTASFIAKKQDAQILAVHMLDIQSDHFNESSSYIQEKTAFLLQLAKKRFHAFLKKDYLKDLKVTPLVKHFKVFSEINDLAKEENADLIIMGSHGASGLKELFIGSNTEKVIRFSEIPVMVIKKDLKDFDFENVVYATDFSLESIDAYVRIKSITEGFKGKIHVVYVNTPYENFKTTPEMEKMAADFFGIADGNIENLKSTTFVSDRSVEKGILSFSNSVGADLIAMSTHARKGLSHFFKGSLSEDVANHASLPILTVKI